MAKANLTVPIILNWKDVEAYMAQHDIVQVVRCKDCKYYGEMLPFADDRMICHALALNFEDDFYCGLAERRSDGQT